jgi:hypothetical protein
MPSVGLGGSGLTAIAYIVPKRKTSKEKFI